MKNNIFYKRLEQIAIDGNYPLAKVESITRQQITNLLGMRADSFSNGFVVNMKNCLINRLQQRSDEADRKYFVDFLPSGFHERFPDMKIEKQREDEKRKIIIWLDGK